MSENWVKIILDSSQFTAGERASGEINVSALVENTKIVIKSDGKEIFTVQYTNGQARSLMNEVYSLQEEFSDLSSSLQSVFPFTFKIPQYAPASFHFKDTDDEGNLFTSEIIYSLEAVLVSNGSMLTKDSLCFTVFNKLSRVIIPPSIDSISQLTYCCCLSRGSSQILIESLNNLHVHCSENKKYKIWVNSENNQYLESVIMQLVFDIKIELPGEKEKFIRKVVNRCVPDLQSVKKEAGDIRKLEFIFDADLKMEIGSNPSSNQSVFCNTEYKVQIFTIYNIGWRSKRAELEIFLQVNPVSIPQRKVEFPPDWSPREKNLKSLLVSAGTNFEKSE